MFLFQQFVAIAATRLVEALLDWRAGPETPVSLRLRQETDSKRKAIERLGQEVAELERQRLLERRQAKAAAPGWFATNRQALLVNIIGGLIYSVPLLIIGIVIGQALD